MVVGRVEHEALKREPTHEPSPEEHQEARAPRDRLAREASSILSKEALSREVAISRIRDALLGAGVATSRAGGGHER